MFSRPSNLLVNLRASKLSTQCHRWRHPAVQKGVLPLESKEPIPTSSHGTARRIHSHSPSRGSKCLKTTPVETGEDRGSSRLGSVRPGDPADGQMSGSGSRRPTPPLIWFGDGLQNITCIGERYSKEKHRKTDYIKAINTQIESKP